MQAELGKKSFYRKRAHANTRWFNDREVSGHIGPFNNPGGKSGADLRYGRHWQPEQYNARRRRQAGTPSKLTKILIEGQHDPCFSCGPRQYVFVFHSRRGSTNPNDACPAAFN
jgi:hypothetical protein